MSRTVVVHAARRLALALKRPSRAVQPRRPAPLPRCGGETDSLNDRCSGSALARLALRRFVLSARIPRPAAHARATAAASASFPRCPRCGRRRVVARARDACPRSQTRATSSGPKHGTAPQLAVFSPPGPCLVARHPMQRVCSGKRASDRGVIRAALSGTQSKPGRS